MQGLSKEIYDITKNQVIKIWDWSEEQWDQIIKTNSKIPFSAKTRSFGNDQTEKGNIINISSRMGRIASQMGAYACAKAGIVTLTKTTAIQAQEYGIRCNAPPNNTDMHRDKGLIIILLDKMKLRWETQTVWARPLFI